MWRALIFVAALAACGDNKDAPKDAAPDDAVAIDAAIDGATTAIGPCLDRPTEATKAPNGQLPCELISPGFHP